MERTLVLIKPDAVERRLIGRIVARFEERGLTIVGMKLVQLPESLVRTHYAEHEGKPFYEPLVRFMTSGATVAMALEGIDCIRIVRDMMGKTFGCDSTPGTIRGDFAVSKRFNLVHGSDSPESATKELGLFFDGQELLDRRPSDLEWMYDFSTGEPI